MKYVIEEAVEAATAGAANTKTMKAKAGRASYVASEKVFSSMLHSKH